MTSVDIKNMSLLESKSILKQFRLYKDLSKKLGKRGRSLFKEQINGTHRFVVEYYPNIETQYVLEKALVLYARTFQVTPQKADIVLIPKENLMSGMKVYYDDNCVDLSFKNIEGKLSKN